MMDRLSERGRYGKCSWLSNTDQLNHWGFEIVCWFLNVTVWEKKAIDVQWLAMLPDVKTLSYARNYPLLPTIRNNTKWFSLYNNIATGLQIWRTNHRVSSPKKDYYCNIIIWVLTLPRERLLSELGYVKTVASKGGVKTDMWSISRNY